MTSPDPIPQTKNLASLYKPLTLRQEYAKAAMSELMDMYSDDTQTLNGLPIKQGIAELAFAFADAMIAHEEDS